MSVDDLESLEETLDVLNDEPLMADIREALAERTSSPPRADERRGAATPAWSVRPYRNAWSEPARRSVQRISDKIAAAITEFLYGSLADNPHRRGKPLTLGMAGLYSARGGDYRIIYEIDEDKRVVEVVAIEHRSDVYRARRR